VTARAFATTRVLHPIQANPDGTFTYAFVMDPRIPGYTYQILSDLKKGFPAAEAERLAREFDAMLAGRQEQLLFVVPRP
jgi:hypothetical protein